MQKHHSAKNKFHSHLGTFSSSVLFCNNHVFFLCVETFGVFLFFGKAHAIATCGEKTKKDVFRHQTMTCFLFSDDFFSEIKFQPNKKKKT